MNLEDKVNPYVLFGLRPIAYFQNYGMSCFPQTFVACFDVAVVSI
jgi:hypothetical protein